jgi:Uma2 family endonuclease
MADPARKQASYQDILDAPSGLRAEIIDGELHLNPRPARRHAVAASVLGMDLGGAFHRGRGGPGGWVIVDEPELHIGAHVLVPDLGGWRQPRFPIDEQNEPYFTAAPDWICEVLSPRTAKYDRGRKLSIYAEAGVEFAWLVDPRLRTLEVYRRQSAGWLLQGTHCDEALVRAEPFDAIELELGALWQHTGEPSPAT